MRAGHPVVHDPQAARRAWILGLAVASTLAWIPGGFTRFVFAKLLVLACACLLASRLRREASLPRALALTVAVGSVVLAVAALAGPTPVASLVGRWPRYEGLPVIGLYVAAAWLGARAVGADGRHLAPLHRALSVGSLVLFLVTVLETVGHSPLGPSNLDRPGSLLGNATDQAAVGLMMLAVLLAAVLRTPDRLLAAGALAALGTVALSGSRAGIGVALVAIVVVTSVGASRRRVAWGAAAAVVLAGTALAIPGTRDRLTGGRTLELRLVQWRLSAEQAADHLPLGLGPSGYEDGFGRYETREWIELAGARDVPDSPHSWVLQAVSAGGVPLLLVALAVAALVLVSGLRAARRTPALLGLLVAVVGYGVMLSINFTAAGPTCLAALLAGALVATPAGNAPSWQRPAASALAVAAMVATGTAALAEVELQRGVDAAARGDVAEASSAFDSARALRPYDGDVAMIAAQALAAPASDGDLEAASATESAARRSLARTPDTYASQVALGVSLITQQRLDEAVTVLDAAVADAPVRPSAYVQRAVARFGLRDVAGARADLLVALELDPRDPSARRVLREIERRFPDGSAS